MRTGSPLPPPSTHLHDQNAHDATRCTGACQVSPRAHLLETNFSRSSYSSGRAGVCGFPSWSPRARIRYAAAPAGATSTHHAEPGRAWCARVNAYTPAFFCPQFWRADVSAQARQEACAPWEALKEAMCTTQEILAAANLSRPSHYARPHTHTRRPPSANVNVKFQSTARTTRGKAQAAMRGHIGVTAVGASHEERLGHLPLPIYVAHVGDGASPCRRCASPKPPCAATGSRVSESRSARSRHGGSDAQRVRIGQGRGRLRMRGCSAPGQRRRGGSLWRHSVAR